MQCCGSAKKSSPCSLNSFREVCVLMKSIVRVLVAACAIVAMAVPASAQVYTGRIDVTVADATGAILPGVTVDISGPQNQTAVTDEKGEAHILSLQTGDYT